MGRYIVCCGGSQTKWKNHLGVPSHLVPDLSGEPILHRTVRLLRERGVGDIVVMGPSEDSRYRIEGTRFEKGRPESMNEFWASRHLWDSGSQTVLVLGDVWFTEYAMDVITSGFEGLRFYGRRGANHLTGTPWGELFASSFWPEDQDLLDFHMSSSYRLFQSGRAKRHIGWEILRSVQGQTNLSEHKVNSRWFVEINDLTDDLDFPIDYQRHPLFGKGDK